MMVQLWENWTLFHPSDWVPLILGELGMEVSDGPWDACWSYEFEDSSNSRLADITLHIRDGTGRETLIVIEGKWNKDRLKGKPKVGLPDADPNAYINLEGYKVVEERRMVYLVHEHAVDRTRDLVRRHITEKSCPWAILTWESLICQQFRLAEELLPKPIGQTICESILAQAKHDCISWEAVQRSTGRRKESVASVQNLVESLKTESAAADCIPRLRDYLMGASCFWESRAEGCCDTNALPFAYLHAEPSFRDLHDEILRRKAGRKRCDYLAENLIPHWQLGIRSKDVASTSE
jgi:hypothetical protein